MTFRESRALVLAAATVAAVSMVGTPALAQCGGASWYSLPRSKTANGERMNPAAMTAAHRSLPFGTKVQVTNQRNGKAVVLRINDRGPFIKGRVIDVSKAAAQALGFVGAGHTKICIQKH